MAGGFSYDITVEGLDDLGGFGEDLKQKALLAAVQAINKTAERARTKAAERIKREINFPPSYLAPAAGKLTVSRTATKGTLEAAVGADRRATSLARFVTNRAAATGQLGVKVQVQPGRTQEIPRAFLIRLRAGNLPIDTKSNLGLAIRLKPGESLKGAYQKKRMARGLYLLYGPSVDQAFMARKANTGIAGEIEDETLAYLNEEFQRNLARLL